MAPTSILAEQHFCTLTGLLTTDELIQPDEIALLTGSTPTRERSAILEKLADGRVKVIVGTHALIEDPVIFQSLQLAVIDEQHRFGVEQRAILHQKGNNPHFLVMTATPIPRSLALTVYGDLDVTTITEMPAGRLAGLKHACFPPKDARMHMISFGNKFPPDSRLSSSIRWWNRRKKRNSAPL